MSEQMMDGDGFFVVGNSIEKFGDGISDLEFSLLFQLHHSRCCERLGDRTDIKHSFGGYGELAFSHGPAVPFMDHYLPILRNKNST